MYNVDSFTKFYMIVKLQQTFAFRLAETLDRVLILLPSDTVTTKNSNIWQWIFIGGWDGYLASSCLKKVCSPSDFLKIRLKLKTSS